MLRPVECFVCDKKHFGRNKVKPSTWSRHHRPPHWILSLKIFNLLQNSLQKLQNLPKKVWFCPAEESSSASSVTPDDLTANRAFASRSAIWLIFAAISSFKSSLKVVLKNNKNNLFNNVEQICRKWMYNFSVNLHN